MNNITIICIIAVVYLVGCWVAYRIPRTYTLKKYRKWTKGDRIAAIFLASLSWVGAFLAIVAGLGAKSDEPASW